jgi:hypothetical protein
MSITDFEIDDVLNEDMTDSGKPKRTVKRLDYYNRSYTGLSYSRSMDLHRCPRKFELNSKYQLFPRKESVTFAYGHAVGAGVQRTLAGDSLNKTILATMLEYDFPVDKLGEASEIMADKSLWHALLFVRRFHTMYHAGYFSHLAGWEVAKFEVDGQTILGVELTFVIDLGDGFTHEGHIDIVLYHPVRNRYLVVELKTNGGNVVREEQYENSAQAVGYGAVIDVIAHNMAASSSFDVLYIVAKSRTQEYLPMLFTKTPADKARWLYELTIDKSMVEYYEQIGHYPLRGEACFDYYRPCSHYHWCKEDTATLEARQLAVAVHDTVLYSKMETPTFFFSLQQLIDRQHQITQILQTNSESEVDMLIDIKLMN